MEKYKEGMVLILGNNSVLYNMYTHIIKTNTYRFIYKFLIQRKA